jgi:cobalt-zinc-cadmium efflux system outer membrane protein
LIRAALTLPLFTLCLFGHVHKTMAQETTASDAARQSLTLAEVLDIVAATHPQLEAARQRQRAADGDAMAARGGFDPVVRAIGQYVPIGAFPRGTVDVELRQPTPLWGLSVYGGWRLGLGSFAVYDLRGKTADGGEVRGGVNLPLWQGGAIDRRRADVSIASLAQDAAAADLDARAIELQRAAGRAYWAWVGAGLRLEVQRDLLKLAQDRDEALRKQIVAGGVPPVEGIDNRRAIVDRGARIIAGERALQQAAFDLARHLRDAEGEVQTPAPARLPGAFPEPQRPGADVSEQMIREAWARRPELRRLALQREAAAVELKLARNNRSPKIDLDAYAAKDIGAVDPAYAYLRPAEFVASVRVELPLALRGARGKLRRAEADLARIDAELRMARDVVALELRDAHSALAAAHARVALAREQLSAAHELELAERSRFRLGDSTLLLVNLREQAATDAALQELEALGEYHRAQVDLRAAAGLFGP